MSAMRQISIKAGAVQLNAKVLDTPTGDAIYQALPLRSEARTWGEEVYFAIPVRCGSEPEAREVMEPGEIAYWVSGSCIAIGFGPTPVSRGEEIRLASAANVWARTSDNVRLLAGVREGDPVVVEALDP